MSEEKAADLDKLIEIVQSEVNEYENQRQVCLSFREHFSSLANDIKVWSEPVIILPTGGFKTPDLLLAQRDWLTLDYKEITSTVKSTLNSHLLDVEEYRSSFTFGSKNFEPDVAIICPWNIAPAFKDIVNTVPILGCKLGKTIRMRHFAGKFKSREISNIFLNEITFPLAVKLTMQKFLRNEPKAVAYTAEIVRNVLWQLNQTLGSDDIIVARGDLIEAIRTFYPPYLRSHKGKDFDIQQVTEGRVNKALEFLRKISFVTIKKEPRGKELDDSVMTTRTKGRDITDFKDYFIRKEAELRYDNLKTEKNRLGREQERKLRKIDRERKKQKLKTEGQESLEKFF